jgi:hypothetical protein
MKSHKATNRYSTSQIQPFLNPLLVKARVSWFLVPCNKRSHGWYSFKKPASPYCVKAHNTSPQEGQHAIKSATGVLSLLSFTQPSKCTTGITVRTLRPWLCCTVSCSFTTLPGTVGTLPYLLLLCTPTASGTLRPSESHPAFLIVPGTWWVLAHAYSTDV